MAAGMITTPRKESPVDAPMSDVPDPRDEFEQITAGLDLNEITESVIAERIEAQKTDKAPEADEATTSTSSASAAPEAPAEPPKAAPVPAAATPATSTSSAAADVPVPAAAPDVLDVDEAPDLAVPPMPKPHESKGLDRWSNAMPYLVWVSVAAGLLGQFVGWTEIFGGGAIAMIIAGLLGGVFEFFMVSGSARGLKALGRGRSWWQVAAFMLVGTACAGLAFYMNLNHFSGELALAGKASAACTLLGYSAHVFGHLFDKLEDRREFLAWKAEAERVKKLIAEREEAARAAHDAEQEAIREARVARIKATARETSPKDDASGSSTGTASAPTTAPATPSGAAKPAGRKPANGESNRATKADAVRIGVEQRISTPAPLKAALKAAGFVLPNSSSTVENWCREIKRELSK